MANKKPELYDYQVKLISDLREMVASKKRHLCAAAPTGSGKTVVMGQMVGDARRKGKTVLIIVHLEVLIRQTYEQFCQFVNPKDIGFVKAEWKQDLTAPIQIASLQSLQSRSEWRDRLNPDLVLFDEAHESSFTKVGKEIIHSLYPHAVIIGFTATPWRLKKHESLSQNFEDLAQAPVPRKLQEMGFLCPLEYYCSGSLDDLKGDDLRTDKKIAIATNKPQVIGEALDYWEKIAQGKKTIVFCVTVDHAENVARAFTERGYKAAVVSAHTPSRERQKLYQELENGDLVALVSVDVLAIGFDRKDIEVGILFRPTLSIAKHHQQLGRLMRVAPNKEKAIILDVAGNCLRFGEAGFPELIQKYSFDNPAEKKKGETPYKICPKCKKVHHLSKKTCECGYKFPGTPKKEVIGKLEKTNPLDKDPQKDSPAKHKRFFQGKMRFAYDRGYAPGFAYMKYKERYGKTPPYAWKENSVFDEFTMDNAALYMGYLIRIAHTKGKPRDWVRKEFLAQFGRAGDICDYADLKIAEIFDGLKY